MRAALAGLSRLAVSCTLLFNALAALALTSILLGMYAAGAAAMIFVPFWLLFLVCGLPWVHFSDLNGMVANEASWSPNNLYYGILTVRGVFINATLLGGGIDLWRWYRRKRGGAVAAGASARRHPWQLTATAVVVMLVLTMSVLPITHYGRLTRLRAGWRELANAVPVGFKPPPHSEAGVSTKGRRDLAALTAAIDAAIHADRSKPDAVTAAERALSAALLCIESSGSANYGRVTIGDIHLEAIERVADEAAQREAALRSFLALLDHRYTLPAGSGCAADAP